VKRISYLHGLALMLGAVMPSTCLLASVAAWLDPEESASFVETLVNNGIAIYALMFLPFSAVSAVHTRVRRGRQGAPRSLSIALGTGLGLGVVGMVVFAMFRTFVPETWGLLLWGAVTGGAYGAVVGVGEARALG
jgi:hypothetical protein